MEKRDIDPIVEQALGIAERLIKASRARSATPKAPDLTEAEIVLLSVLAKRSGRPVSVREALQETGFSPSRLSKLIKELESRKRFLKSQRAEGDRRRVDLIMEEQGLKALGEFNRLRRKRLRLVFQQLSHQDFKMVSEAMVLFSQGLDRALGGRHPQQVGSLGAEVSRDLRHKLPRKGSI